MLPNRLQSNPSIAFIPLALLLAAACDTDRPSARMSVLVTTVDTIDGVVHVVNRGDAPEWRFALESSIGPKTLAVGEGGPEEFGQVWSAALGPHNDEIYIGDGHYTEVRVFGRDGTHRRTFGRSGEGPGEFSHINSVAWVGDRLLVLDLIGGRIGEFSAAGEVLGQRAAPGRWGGSEALRLYPVARDEAWSVSHVVGEDGLQLVYVGQSAAGETGDTLAATKDFWDQSVSCEYNDGWISFFEIIYSPQLVQHPGPAGTLYLARTDAYRIAVVSGGDTLRVIERELPSEPVTDEEWASATEDFRNFLDEQPRADCTPRRPERPALKPFIRTFFIAPDSRIWVEAMRAEGNRWEVFDPEGRLLGSMPAREFRENSVPAFGPDHVLTIRQDSLELDHVDVWRIER